MDLSTTMTINIRLVRGKLCTILLLSNHSTPIPPIYWSVGPIICPMSKKWNDNRSRFMLTVPLFAEDYLHRNLRIYLILSGTVSMKLYYQLMIYPTMLVYICPSTYQSW